MRNTFHTVADTHPPGLRLPLRVVDQLTPAWLALDCFKLVLLESGSGFVRVGDARRAVATPALLCLNAKESAQIPPTIQGRAVLFLPELVNGSVSACTLEKACTAQLGLSGLLDYYWAEAFERKKDARPRVLELPPCAARKLTEQITRMRFELDQQRCEFWPSWARSFLIEALFLAGRLFHAPGRDTHYGHDDPDHAAAPVVNALQSRLAERFTLASLAREFHTNRTTLQKQFRAYTGMTIAAYVRDLRLTRARALLSETSLPVHEIAAQTGFADLTNFARAFRKAHRLSPARYRRLHP